MSNSSSDDDDEDFVPPPSPQSQKARTRRREVSAADADASTANTAAATRASANASDAFTDLNVTSGVSQRAVDKSAKFLSRLTSKTQPKRPKKRKLREFQVPVLSLDVHKRRTDISAAAAAASASANATVHEVVKFAGVEYSVATKATTAAPRSVNASGLDHVLATLDAPKKVTTMEKTSLDWDKFKAIEGIDDELQQHIKDGYLAKQDFLQRVDVQQFELEKAARDRKRKLQQQQQQQQPPSAQL